MNDKRQWSFKWLRWGVMFLLVGVIVVWVTSAWAAVTIDLKMGDGTVGFDSRGGVFSFNWTSSGNFTPPPPPLSYRFSDSRTTAWSTLRRGFSFPDYSELIFPIVVLRAKPANNQVLPELSPPVARSFSLPMFWPVLVLSGTLVALSVVSRKAVRRMAEGHCPACGYDLRASVGACPECGAMNPKQASDPGAKAPAFTQATGERGRV